MLATFTYAAAIARIQAVGTLIGVPVDRLVEAIGGLYEGQGRTFRLSVPDDFSAVSVLAAAPRELSQTHTLASAPPLDSVIPSFAERRGELLVELDATGADGQLTTALHALGSGRLEDDLAILARMAREPAAEFATPARVLAAQGRSAGVSARLDGSTMQLGIHVPLADSAELARDGLVEAASALGITSAQRNLIAAVHPLLAGRASAVASLHIGSTSVERALTVTYQDLAFESVIRILIGIHPGVDHASRLGKVAGACGAERAAALSLLLRDREPLGLRVGFDLELSAGNT